MSQQPVPPGAPPVPPQGPPVAPQTTQGASRVHLEKYNPWQGSFQPRHNIISDTILEGVRQHFRTKWVKPLIALAWLITMFIPLLVGVLGGMPLTQDAGEGGDNLNYEEAYEMLAGYDPGFPLSHSIQQGEAALYNVTVMNSGERPDIITVLPDVRSWNWSAVLSPENGEGFYPYLNLSLAAGEYTRVTLVVIPPEELSSGEGEVDLIAYSQGAQAIDDEFGEFEDISERLRTITVVGHTEESPFHFQLLASEPSKTVPSRGEVVFSYEIRNTGQAGDSYFVAVEGLPKGWDATVEGLDFMGVDPEGNALSPGVHLQPGEARNFTVTFEAPKYPSSINFLGVVASSGSDHTLSRGAVTMVEATDIPGRDLTASTLAEPGDSLYTFTLLFALFLGAVVGARAISDDLAEKSYTIYFARPISKWDYMGIKFGTVALTMSTITILPWLVTYLGLILLNGESMSYVLEHLRTWAAIILYGLLITVLFTSLVLAFSSSTPKRFYAAFGFVVSYLISTIISNIVRGAFEQEKGSVVSIGYSLGQVQGKIFDVPDVVYEYDWGYNLLALLMLILVANGITAYKIWKTELSE